MLAPMPIPNPQKTVITPMRAQQERLRTLVEGTGQIRDVLTDKPLAEQLKVFERIERGAIDRATADPAFVHEVEAAVEQILQVVYQPLDGGPFIVPRDAWTRSPLMRLLASVTYWLYQDELISPADAARLLYGSSNDTLLARVRRAIERGELRHYWRPGRERKSAAAFLVRRSEVERLKQTLTDEQQIRRNEHHD